jgi:hypothetical protein
MDAVPADLINDSLAKTGSTSHSRNLHNRKTFSRRQNLGTGIYESESRARREPDEMVD